MEQSTTEGQNLSIGSRDILTDILRRGAEEMLAMAIENEVAEYIARHAHLRDGEGRRLVVRNGHLPARTIQTGIGDMAVRQPRVNDKRIDSSGRRVRFSSSILPPYLRRTKSVEELIPWLYLKGVSTGDFTEALQALLGPQAQGLSATNIVRLKTIWQQEWAAWSKRSLEDKQYVYVWADGIHFNIRLEDPGNNKQCILVLMGATADGRKELIAIADGYRESTQSWRNCFWMPRNEAYGPIRRWLQAMVRWASGRLCGRFIRRLKSNAAGCTRRPTCSTKCPRRFSPRPSRCCMISGWPRHARRPKRRSICSW